MVRNSSEIYPGLHLVPTHFCDWSKATIVYPVPADLAWSKGEWPYLICGCGKVKKLGQIQDWEIEDGEWKFTPQYPSKSAIMMV